MIQYIPISLSALASTWFFTRNRRKLPTTQELLQRLHPGALKGLDDFLPHNPIKDLVDSDKEFWKASGGYKGLMSRVNNAVCFVQLCQRLERDNGMPREAILYIFRKAFWQLFFSLGAIPEEVIRVIFRNMPHVSARFATHLYWELENLAQGFNAEFGSENWISYA